MTAATAYVPQPGTIAARVMAIIDTLAPDESIPNAALGERLEQPSNVILASLKAAERHGLIERCSEGGYAIRWRKGDGTPPANRYGDSDEAAEGDTAPPVQRVVKAEAGAVALLMRGQLGAPPPVSGDFDELPANEVPPEPEAAPAVPPKGMRVALWSDGSLQIQRACGDLIALTTEETRHLVRYLERMAESGDATA